MGIISSVDAVKQRVTNLLTPLASQYNLSLTAFGDVIFSDQETRYGTLTLSDAWGTALEPAPLTPTDPHDAPYKLLSGSIKSSLLDSELFRDTNTTVIISFPVLFLDMLIYILALADCCGAWYYDWKYVFLLA